MPETSPPTPPQSPNTPPPPIGHPADDRDVRLRRALAIVWGPWVHDLAARSSQPPPR